MGRDKIVYKKFRKVLDKCIGKLEDKHCFPSRFTNEENARILDELDAMENIRHELDTRYGS